jgi:parallel beta-helix repeat protein
MARSVLGVGAIVIAGLMVSVVFGASVSVMAYALHEPIVIRGNNAFTAANGVSAGTGTAADPYVIEGLEFSGQQTAIDVSYTHAYFIIRDILIDGYWASDSAGIRLSHVLNGIVERVEATRCNYGIDVIESSAVTIQSCTVHDTTFGIVLTGCSGVAVNDNTVFSNLYYGIELAGSTFCAINRNSVTANGEGFLLDGCRNIAISGNVFTMDGMEIWGKVPWEYDSHVITTDNLVGGLPIYYFAGVSHKYFDGMPVGQVILASCTDFTFYNMNFANAADGLEMAFTDEVFVEGCTFQNNVYGTYIYGCYFVDIRSCVYQNNENGVVAVYSDSVTVYESSFTGNLFGIIMSHTTGIMVSGGNAGFTITGGNAAAWFMDCSWVTFCGVHVAYNFDGIYIRGCTETWVYANEIAYNTDSMGTGTGIIVSGGKKITIEQNNFIANDIQVKLSKVVVVWDNGWSRGNYWSDYTGVDTDGDAIGETPYVIDSKNQDNFPLVIPYGIVPY